MESELYHKSDKMESELYHKSDKMESELYHKSDKMESEETRESDNMESELYHESDNIKSKETHESEKMESELFHKSGNIKSKETHESDKIESELHHKSKKMKLELTHKSKMIDSELNYKSDKMESEQTHKSEKMESELHHESNKMETELHHESKKMESKLHHESNKIESELQHESNMLGQQKEELLKSFIESPSFSLARELLEKHEAFSQSELANSIITACHRGHKFLIKILVDLGANVNMKDSHGNTPLMICAQNGLTDVCDYLICRGADVNEVNDLGDTALILSIRPAGSWDITKLFLEQKQINIHQQNKDGYTALMKALEIMDIDVVKLLLHKDDKMEEDSTCLEKVQKIADKSGIGKVFKILLEAKQRKVTPLEEAIEGRDMEACEILLNCKFADKGSKIQTMKTFLNALFESHHKSKQDFYESEVKLTKRLVDRGVQVNHLSPYYVESNPLIIAIEVGSYNMVKLLCEKVTDIESFYYYEHLGPLAAAAKIGRRDLVYLLIKFGIKVNADHFKNSPLDCAFKHKHTDCANLLIKHGAIMDIKEAFKSAVSEQLPEYVKFLAQKFKREVSMHLTRNDFSDLLVSASGLGNLEIIDFFLEAGADINYAKRKKTPLMESYNAEVVNFLIEKGAVVNKWRRHLNSASSPLTYVLGKESPDFDDKRRAEVIQALLENGADVNGKSFNGNTPLSLAYTHGRSKEIVQMLKKYGAKRM